jgi:hypothetical protein
MDSVGLLKTGGSYEAENLCLIIFYKQNAPTRAYLNDIGRRDMKNINLFRLKCLSVLYRRQPYETNV